MNFSLHLSDDLVHRLNAMAQATGKSRNALIREAIEEWLARRERCEWPEEVLSFQGVLKMVPFERARAELLPPKEPFNAVSA
jgi:metal-responsive CopG/Arc/MetJ family transcriptional regulator